MSDELKTVPLDYVAGFLRAVKGCLQDESLSDVQVATIATAQLEKYKEKRLADFVENYFKHQGLKGVQAYLNTIPNYLQKAKVKEEGEVLEGLGKFHGKRKPKVEEVANA